MNRYLRILCILICICVLSTVGMVCAHTLSARNERKFYSFFERSNLAIAMFYCVDKELRRDPNMRCRLEKMDRIFDRMSSLPRFKQGGLLFIAANTNNDDINQLAHTFGVKQLPSFVLFRDSEPIAILAGFALQAKLVRFIDNYFSDDLASNIKDYRERRLERALYGPRCAIGVGISSPCWGCYDPWYSGYGYWGGCGPGWGGCAPRWGGCGPCWGRPAVNLGFSLCF